MLKKLISISGLVALVLPSVALASFEDIPEDHELYDAI